MRRADKVLRSASLVFAAGASAILPLVVLSSVASGAAASAANALALCVVWAGFIAQLGVAFFVEAQLATDPNRILGLPKAVVLSWFAAVIVLIGLVGVAPSLFPIGFGVVLIGNEVTRAIGQTQGRYTLELASAFVCLAGALAFRISGSDSFRFEMLLLIIALATLLRFPNFWGGYEHPRRTRAVWVLAETGVTGAVQPLIVGSAVAGGGTTAVQFRLATSLANLMSPLLAFIRYQVLRRGAVYLAALGAAGVACGSLVVIGGNVAGIWPRFFGSGWQVETAALVGCCVWKALSLLSTFPFGALRRRGLVRAVLYCRVVSTLVYGAGAWVALGANSGVLGLVAALVIGELVTVLLYWTVERFLR